MEELFAARHIDPDTRIYSETYHDVNGLPVLIEHWGWDGINASSFVIPRASLGSHDETSLITLLRSYVDFGQYTYSNNPDNAFVFVNHGFYRTED